MKKLFLKSLLVGAALLVGSSAWAGDKTVIKYSFDNAMQPTLSAGSRSALNYDYTSVVSSTVFLNIWGENNPTGGTTISLGDTDLSGEIWTLEFNWAGYSGCNKKAGHTYLKAGSTNLFDIADAADWGKTFNLSYGEGGSATLACYPCNNSSRISANTGGALNTVDYWHHFKIVGSSEGVKLTVTNAKSGTVEVDGVTLSATNVNPTAIVANPGSCGSVAFDELVLSYYVEGEVIQTPIAAYTKVDGIERTVTATCDTEGATIQHSTDGVTYTDGASVTVDASGKIYFKGVKGSSESDPLEFDVEAGEAITLIAPTINRTSDNSVTITAEQSSLLLSPTATIYYEYGSETGSFTGSKNLTVAAEATITAYAVAEGYTTSATSSRAVKLFPAAVVQVENATYTKSYEEGAYSGSTTTGEKATYDAYLLDGKQWGSKVYLQTSGWGIRNDGQWYVNAGNGTAWLMVKDVKAGDIIVATFSQAATETANATYSEQYTYGTNFAYVVDADGDAELGFKRISTSVNNYFTSIKVYSTSFSGTLNATGYATFSYGSAIEVTGATAYTAAVDEANEVVTLTAIEDGIIPANTGVILKGDAGATVSYTLTTTDATVTDNDLKAAVTAIARPSGNIYVLSGNQFHPLDASVKTLTANKAYLVLSDGFTPSAEANLRIIFDDEATAINALNAAKVESDVLYNVAGQRVNDSYKGIVIKNGKKYLNK